MRPYRVFTVIVTKTIYIWKNTVYLYVGTFTEHLDLVWKFWLLGWSGFNLNEGILSLTMSLQFCFLFLIIFVFLYFF